MTNLIGIIKASHVNRPKIAAVLAMSMEEVLKHVDELTVKSKIQMALESKDAKDDEELYSTQHICIDSFGQAILDTIRIMVPTLYSQNLHDKQIKDNTFINIKTFELTQDPPNVFKPHELFEFIRKQGIKSTIGGCWLSVGDFILYFANYVMRNFMGDSFWINSTIDQNRPGATIFYDVRCQGEYDFIRNNNGKIIYLAETDPCYLDGKFNWIPDYTLVTTGKIELITESFYKTASQLVKDFS